MNTRKLLPAAICITLLLAVRTSPCIAWWAIAHYEIAKAAVGADIARYAQIPDYVDSWYLTAQGWLPAIGGQVDDYFCWSHAVEDTGSVPDYFPLLVPGKPWYPRDGRHPELAMWDFVQHKMDTSALPPQDLTTMRYTALGCCAHNAADGGSDGALPQSAHFEYFLGGTIDNWYHEHRLKEQWADLWTFIDCRFQGNAEEAFNLTRVGGDDDNPIYDGWLDLDHIWQNGGKIDDTEYSCGIPVFGNGFPTVESVAPMALIMSQAQKAYRKDRLAMHIDQICQKITVQPWVDIQNTYLSAVVAPCSRDGMRSLYSYGEFQALNLYPWCRTELRDRRNETINIVRDWVTTLQGQ